MELLRQVEALREELTVERARASEREEELEKVREKIGEDKMGHLWEGQRRELERRELQLEQRGKELELASRELRALSTPQTELVAELRESLESCELERQE